jgi:hypothetical protein
LANAYHFTIGSYFTPNYYFPGLIDDVRIFSSALSAYEIQKLYAEGIKGHNDVVASAK